MVSRDEFYRRNAMPSHTPKLTQNELTCIKLAAKMQRRAWRSRYVDAFIPRIPWHHAFNQQPLHIRMLLYFAMFLLSPIWLTGWFLQLLCNTALFPYRITATYFISLSLIPPGERNIQGMHRATQRYLDLSVKQYIWLVNQWVEVLYGEKAKRIHTMQYYLDKELVEQREITRGSLINMDPYIRNHIGSAREKLSQALGYY